MGECRTCMGQLNGKNCINVEAHVIDELNVLQAIQEVSSLEGLPDDLLPKHICKKCFKLLQSTTLFRRLIIDSYMHFTDKLKNHLEAKNQNIDECSSAFIKAIGLLTNDNQKTNIKIEETLSSNSQNPKKVFEINITNRVNNNSHVDPDQAFVRNANEKGHKVCEDTMDQVKRTEGPKRAEIGVKTRKQFSKKIPKDKPVIVLNNDNKEIENKNQEYDEDECDAEQLTQDHTDTLSFTEKCIETNGSNYKGKKLTSQTCTLCCTVIKGKKKYKMHMKSHDTDVSPLEYVCSICPKRYPKKEYLLVHTRSHTGEKPYHCNICNKNFSQFATYYVHKRRLHDKVVQGTCNYCGKMFVDKPELDVHIKMWHTGERPYLCEFCSATFVCNRTLQRHRKEIHSEKKPCQKCGKMLGDYALKKHLVRHQVLEEGLKIVRKKYTCEYCKTVMNFTSRRRHLEKQHGIKLHGRGDDCTKIPIKGTGEKTKSDS